MRPLADEDKFIFEELDQIIKTTLVSVNRRRQIALISRSGEGYMESVDNMFYPDLTPKSIQIKEEDKSRRWMLIALGLSEPPSFYLLFNFINCWFLDIAVSIIGLQIKRV